MGILNDLKPNKTNTTDNNVVTPAVSQAQQGYENAEQDTLKAIQALGKAVYEAEKDNTASPFFANIKKIKECIEKEYLWQLYQLSLEGKTKCESCGAIITSDSIFCNKCAAKIPERDFSVIGMMSEFQTKEQNVCPNCGCPLIDGAVFCEKCGTKILSSFTVSESISDNRTDNSICPKCGATLTEGAMFCEKCGTKLV